MQGFVRRRTTTKESPLTRGEVNVEHDRESPADRVEAYASIPVDAYASSRRRLLLVSGVEA